jgi:hypothetical protein
MPSTERGTEPDCRDRDQLMGFIPAVLACLVLMGCASNSTPTTSPPASPKYSVQLCTEAAAYQMAANAIVTLDANAAGVDGAKKALLDLQTAANNLVAVAAAENQFPPQVAELEKASTSLNATISGLTSQDSLSANIGKITASVSAVEQAARPIVDGVRPGCPSVPTAATPPTS